MPPRHLLHPPFSSPLYLIRPSHLPLPRTPSRPASHASQGRANKAAPGPGKRLGLKRPALSLVVPGNIIFRQRGTHWFPGENCGMGRDHTIFARERGYVVFYRGVVGQGVRGGKWGGAVGGGGVYGAGGGGNGGMRGSKGRERKFIGVVFERGESLPRSEGSPRRRRLGLVSRERHILPPADAAPETGDLVEAQGTLRAQPKTERAKIPERKQKLELRPGYQYRESNWSIGRAAERAGVKVRKYKKGDRALARRRSRERKAADQERLALGSRKRKGKK
ncbi:54S ribosomal protein L2 mitochondrial [Lecanora helva]